MNLVEREGHERRGRRVEGWRKRRAMGGCWLLGPPFRIVTPEWEVRLTDGPTERADRSGGRVVGGHWLMGPPLGIVIPEGECDRLTDAWRGLTEAAGYERRSSSVATPPTPCAGRDGTERSASWRRPCLDRGRFMQKAAGGELYP